MKHGTPNSIDQMLEQLELGTQTKKILRAAIRDYLGNKLNVFSMSGDERQEALVMDIFNALTSDEKKAA